MAERVAPVEVGDIVADKYRIERVLGRGGMGVVVAARHLQLGQLVALKFLLPASLANAEVVARFLREARAAVRLRSEHVARVFDVGTTAGPGVSAPYMVMEYLEGSDLRALVHRGRLPIEDAVAYVVQACDAVEEAHQLGIIHRDLKPDNLFLTRRPNGTPLVKVLDFGISKMTIEGDARLTATSTVMGTPHYMSPEQMHSTRNAGPASDVWALGAVLYELLTGEVPFPGSNPTEICSRVLTSQPVPPREFRGDIPVDLEAVILRCLTKDPAVRPASAGELAAALAPFTFARTVPAVSVAADASVAATPASPSPASITGSGGTLATLDVTTRIYRDRGRRGLVVAGLAVASVAAIAIAVLVARAPAPSYAPAASAPTAAPSVAPPTVTASAEPVAPTVSVDVPIVKPASSLATATSLPPRSTAAATAAPAHRPPTPTPTNDGPVRTRK